MTNRIELAEVVQELRQELGKALELAADEDLRFELGPVELELSLVVERSGDAGVKVRFWVADASLNGKLGSVSTQRIKLVLQPWRESKPHERVSIVGESAVGER